jgi:hypothetical protein
VYKRTKKPAPQFERSGLSRAAAIQLSRYVGVRLLLILALNRQQINGNTSDRMNPASRYCAQTFH